MLSVFRRFAPSASCCAIYCAIALMSPVSAVQASPELKESASQTHVLTRDIFAKVLTAELAIQRNNITRGFNEFFSAAEMSGYPELARRALETAEEAQNDEQAQKALALWNRLDPDNERARFTRVSQYFTEGKFDEAQSIAKDLLTEASDPEPLLEEISHIGSDLKEKSRFYEYFSVLAKPYAETSSVQLMLASVAQQAKMGEKAKEHGIRAIELTPDNPHILIQGADYEFALDPKAASKRLENYLKDHPNSHQVRLSYAKSLLRTGEANKLEKELTKIDSAMKDNPRVLLIIGMIAEEGRLYDRAELYYKKYLVEIAKKPAMGLTPDAAYVRLGMVKLSQGHRELAIDWLHKVEAGEQYQAARLKEAELLANTNRVDEACTVLRNIRTEDKLQKAGFAQSCAKLMLQKDHKEQALKVMIETLDLIPEDSEMLYQAARLAEELDKTDQCEVLLRRFIKLNPDNYNGYNSLGYLWISRGVHLKDAEELILKAMDLSGGKNAYVMDSLGWLRHLQGKEEEAEKLLTQAQDTSPSDVEIALHLAEVLFVRGKMRQGEAVVRSVLEGEPNNEQAKRLLKAFDITP